MDRNVTIDVTRIRNLDPRQGRRVHPPHLAWNPPPVQAALEASLRGLASGSGRVQDALSFKSNPSLRVSTVGSIAAAPTRHSSDWTITLGPSLTAAPVAVFNVSGGVYFWNKPAGGEIGLFGAGGLGITTNIGVSLVMQVCYLFGPAPALLAGDWLTVAVDVGPVPGVTFSGMAIFSMVPEFIGLGFAAGTGLSALPVSLTVEASTTVIAPVRSW